MAWFFVKDVKRGSVFSYAIKNHVVEVADLNDLAMLRKEPDRFQEVADKKEAAILAASLSTSEAEEVPADEEVENVDAEDIEDTEKEKSAPKKKKKIKKNKS